MKKIMILLFLSLLGCDKKPFTEDFLLQHPATLQKEFARCENTTENHCDAVRQAANTFTQLLEERNEHPEAFGQQVMALQTQLASGNIAAQQKLAVLYAVIAATTVE